MQMAQPMVPDEAAVLHESSSSNFIQRLPSDILRNIFAADETIYIYVSSGQGVTCRVCAVALAIIVAQVSQEWRDIALSSPLLWAKVAVDCGKQELASHAMELFLEILRTVLHRSGNVPLCLYLNEERVFSIEAQLVVENSWQFRVIDTALEHAHRLSTLHLAGASGFPPLILARPEVVGCSKLKEVTFSSFTWDKDLSLPLTMPNLTKVQFLRGANGPGLPSPTSLPWSQLTELCIYLASSWTPSVTFRPFLQMLNHTTQLITLCITVYWGSVDLDDEPDDRPIVTLTSLQTLEIFDDVLQSPLSDFFARVQTPNLRNFDFTFGHGSEVEDEGHSNSEDPDLGSMAIQLEAFLSRARVLQHVRVCCGSRWFLHGGSTGQSLEEVTLLGIQECPQHPFVERTAFGTYEYVPQDRSWGRSKDNRLTLRQNKSRLLSKFDIIYPNYSKWPGHDYYDMKKDFIGLYFCDYSKVVSWLDHSEPSWTDRRADALLPDGAYNAIVHAGSVLSSDRIEGLRSLFYVLDKEPPYW